jgi:hypothetical protein
VSVARLLPLRRSAIFLLMYAQGRMPAAFALPAGAGDVAAGALAPIVAVAYARGIAGREFLVVGWNLLGLLDLTNGIATGFLTSPSPPQVLSLDAPNLLIGEYPLVLVPVFGVPLAVLLHVASLVKLGRDAVRRPVLNGLGRFDGKNSGRGMPRSDFFRSRRHITLRHRALRQLHIASFRATHISALVRSGHLS